MTNFTGIVEAFANHPVDESMSKLIDYFENGSPTDEDIVYLTLKLSQSGSLIRCLKGISTADVPSTGGPSSLSTLLCPLYLKALGYTVPKLGVPGRPAGGIDVLAQLQGYKIDFTIDEIELSLKDNGYIHFLANETFAPLDAMLFSYRKRANKINIPKLAIASLLSKKIAAAVSLVGLDVRVAPHGNFGNSLDIASEHSQQFCRVAKLLGMKARCFLSNANVPYQPYIGRGESLVAVHDIFTNEIDPWLRSHNDACYAMVYHLVQLDLKGGVVARPQNKVLAAFFKENLYAQGSSYSQFECYVNLIKESHKMQLRAEKDGFVQIDMRLLRSVIVGLQAKFVSVKNQFPDPCGIILKYSSGAYVYKDETLATIRCVDNLAMEMLMDVQLSIRVVDEPFADFHFREVSHV